MKTPPNAVNIMGTFWLRKPVAGVGFEFVIPLTPFIKGGILSAIPAEAGTPD
jgi:hypothetical protein